MDGQINMDCGWVRERAEAYVLGGLGGEERAALEGHLAGCGGCAQAVAEAQGRDREWMELFAGVQPDAGMEERLVKGFREATMRRGRHMVFKRAAVGIAAAVALAATGVLANIVVQGDRLNNPLTEHLVASAESRELANRWRGAGDFFLARGRMPPATRDEWGTELRDLKSTGNGEGVVRVRVGQDVTYGDGHVDWSMRVTDTDGEGKLRSEGEKASGLRAKSPVDGTQANREAGFGGGAPVVLSKEDKSHEHYLYDGKQREVLGRIVAGQGVKRDVDEKSAQPLQIQGQLDAAQPLNGKELALKWEEAQKGYLDSNGISTGRASNDLDKRNSGHFKFTEETEQNDRLTEEKGRGVVTAPRASESALQGGSQGGENSPADRTAPVATRPAEGTGSAPSVQTVAQQKIIRSGTVEVEVKSFDDAYAAIARIVADERGYVSSTNSQKLENGKIQGTIVLRIPPERLDRVVLSLRGLGEIKSQQITASDITKEYTDIESELRGLRAMEQRLIDLIKTGNGQVKDLVLAEKQLGEYRVRIEKLEGQIRYFNNLVGMSTLTLVCREKDIQQPASLMESEKVTASVEAEDVDARYRAARKLIEQSKGRITESELRRMEGDRLAAHIVCEIPADQADIFAAGLSGLGNVTRLDRTRQQSTVGGRGAPAGNVKVEQKETVFNISMYNVASVPPRETAVLNVAVPDVEAAYRKILAAAKAQPAAEKPAGTAPEKPAADSVGRVLSSSLSGQQAEQMTADISLEVRASSADALLSLIRDSGEVINSSVVQNASQANTTAAKEGVQVRLLAMAALPSRDTVTLSVAATDVASLYQKVLAAVQDPRGPGVRILAAQLTPADSQHMQGTLEFEVKRDGRDSLEKILAEPGVDVTARETQRAANVANTLDTKLRYSVRLVSAELLAPQRTTTLTLQATDVQKAVDDLRGSLAGMSDARARYNTAASSSGKDEARISLNVSAAQVTDVLRKIRSLPGEVVDTRVTEDPRAADGKLARESVEITVVSRGALVPRDRGVWSTVRSALSMSASALLYSLYLIVTGVLFIGPWLLILGLLWRMWRWARRGKAPVA